MGLRPGARAPRGARGFRRLALAATISQLFAGALGQTAWDCTVPDRCPAGQEADCFTAATGLCSPTGLKLDEFCDERHNCGVKDPKCDFEAPSVRHANSNTYGGLVVTDAQTARVLQYVPDTPHPDTLGGATVPADVPDEGAYRVLAEQAGMEEFRLYGTVGVGSGANAKYMYGVTSSTTDHKLYRVNLETQEIDAKSMNNFPTGWTELGDSTAGKWKYSLPADQKASHPCRCTSTDTEGAQGSGLPWAWDTGGTTLVDGSTTAELDPFPAGQTLSVSPYTIDYSSFPDGAAAFVAANEVNYYPAVLGTGTTNAFCAVLEPRLCSMPNQAGAGTTRTASFVDFCAGSTDGGGAPATKALNCLPTCCGCTYGLCDASTTAGTAAFQFTFDDDNAGNGWQGIALAPYGAGATRPTNLDTSANDAQRMYAVANGYGVVKYDLAADGTPTFTGTVLQCEDHAGKRMQGQTMKLTRDGPGAGHDQGMFVVCGRRNSASIGPDSSYVFYCALDTLDGASWREQGRCTYVMGTAGASSATPATPALQTSRVRDLVILDATASGQNIVYDIATVEGAYPNSQMHRYSVTVAHGTAVGTAQPTVPTVSASSTLAVPFLDGKQTPAPQLASTLSKTTFDFFGAAVEPDTGANFRPKRPPASLYVTDFSYNSVIKVPYLASGAATAASATMFGSKAAMVPAGLPIFLDGPVAAMSRVTGIRDSVAGHKVYLKIEANNFASEPADDAGGRGAHIEVSVSGEVNLGGQTITAVIPGVVVARTEDIYSKGCGGTCPANVYWAYYSSTQAGDFEVSVTMGPFNDHCVGSPGTVSVAAAEIDPQRVTVVRDGEANVLAGLSSTILISTYDRFGNQRKVGTKSDEHFKWSLKNSPESMNTIENQNTYSTSAVVSTEASLADGQIDNICEDDPPTEFWLGVGDYRAYRAGTYQFQLFLEVDSQSYNVYADTVVVSAGSVDKAKSRADSPDFARAGADPPIQVVIGTPVSIDITPRDRYSNPVTSTQTFVIERMADRYGDGDGDGCSGNACQMTCETVTASGEYKCDIEYQELSTESYQVNFYLGTLAQYDAWNPAQKTAALIGTGWPDRGGEHEITAVSRDGAVLVCEELDGMHMLIGLITMLVIIIGLGLSVWLSMSKTSSFIQMTSPMLGQVILWGGIIHLFTVLLWLIDPSESGWPADGFNFCSVRMWIFGMTFVAIWGTLALKTYRVRALIMQQSASSAGYQELGDGKLLAYVVVMVFIEMVICCVYSFVGGGPEYEITPCGVTMCGGESFDQTWSIFVAMMAAYNGAIVVFALTQAVQTRHVMAASGGGGDNAASAQNSAAAFVEAPHIGFSIYNMAFTSVILYPITALINYDSSPMAYEVLRAFASIWSCFIVFVFVFGFKIRDKGKFDAQERLNRQAKIGQQQAQRGGGGGGGGGSYAQGGTHSMRGGSPQRGGGRGPPGQRQPGQRMTSPQRGGGQNPVGPGGPRGSSPQRGGGRGPPGGGRGTSPQRGGGRGPPGGGRPTSPPRGGSRGGGGGNWA